VTEKVKIGASSIFTFFTTGSSTQSGKSDLIASIASFISFIASCLDFHS
jgi:hypothetical protein